MNARSAKQPSLRRYRRRILGWGAAGIAGLFAIGGPIFVNRIEDDLERRVVVELEAAGLPGAVTVSFSGQDGELRCRQGPVDIPDDVVDSIRDLWGVSSLVVTASCTDDDRTASGATSDDAASTGATTTDAPSTSEPTDDGDDGAMSSTPAEISTTIPDLDAVAAVITNDSQFSTLTGLLDDAGLTGTLAGDGPFTVFAPTDAAFEALGADITGALGHDPELLATVLTHHVTEDSLPSNELVDGTIEMLDGTTIIIGLTDTEPTEGEPTDGESTPGITLSSADSAAVVTEADLQASNGVVHAIDQVLIPEGVAIGTDPTAVLVGADFVGGQIVLSGTVASEVQRVALVGAASADIDPANVIDELVVDADTDEVDDGALGALAEVIAALPAILVSGSAELSGEGITVNGVAADPTSSEAFAAAMDGVTGATITTTITERTTADAAAATALEADLNALVAANPILFDPSSTAVSAESAATLDRVAALANRVGGVDIEIQGHTDTDGLPASNQALSEGRAESVRAALVERSISDGTLSTVGLGGTRPILDVDGVEDKVASRRVEFVVTVTQ